VDAGIIVLTAFISPYRQDRQQVRSLLSDGQFLLRYVPRVTRKAYTRRPRRESSKNLPGFPRPTNHRRIQNW
jgi:adenylylsulfate kinase